MWVDGSAGTVPVLTATVGPLSTHGAGLMTPTPTPLLAGSTPPPTMPPPPTGTPPPSPIPTSLPTAVPTQQVALPVSGWIAYSKGVQLIPNDPSPSAGGCHIYLLRFDGAAEINVSPPGTSCAASPTFSPDGQWIAFLSGYVWNMSAGIASDLIVVKVDSSEARTFSPTLISSGYVVWAGDMTQIAYFYRGDFKWHVIDAQTGEAIATLDNLSPEGWYLPNLSPDGKYRASYCDDGLSQICITKVSADSRPLGTHFDYSIAWSPDGQWIGYSTSEGSYLMRPDSSEVIRLAELRAGAWWFSGEE